MKQLKAAVWVLALSALAGCAVGPDFKQPDAPQAGRITNQPLPAQTASADASGGDSQVFVAQSATGKPRIAPRGPMDRKLLSIY